MNSFKDASALALAIRQKEVSAAEIVEDTILRAKKSNKALNAITADRYEEALTEAKKGDFKQGIFAGVPIFLKDLGQDMEGLPTSSGSRLFQHYFPKQTDYYVERLQELGFIILGKTNTPEFGFKNISYSKANGPVNLPMANSRNAGGSSGGAAALLSAGITTLGPASDGGGSIRIPASFNGLIGLKPSRGRIPVGPSSYRGWQGASVHFALTKSVQDTRALLYHMQTYQVESPFPLAKLSKDQLYSKELKPLKVACLLQTPDGKPLPQEAYDAVLKASQFLEASGHHVFSLQKLPLEMHDVMSSYYFMNAAETAAMFQHIESGLNRAITKNDMETMTWAIYQNGLNLKAKDYALHLQKWDAFSVTMAHLHEEYDLLLTATTTQVAPKHGQLDPDAHLMAKLSLAEEASKEEQTALIYDMFDKGLAVNPYTPLANLTGQPAISLPTHVTKEGLPLGIQLLVAKGREDLLLAVAEQFESAQQFKTF
ncbi:amidase [Streptococcus iniae]|uniref:amidase n=1 Tax=Streptococcus iniae TaxID=1346 RepID=UPI000EF77FC8|nr:amidase [Streptococcus iniae]RLU90088.1 amidase [Streptococcus iniae]